MHRQQVLSSALESIGYDAASSTLELEFKGNSGVWQYFNFKPSAYKKFRASESLGNFFVRKIKSKYPELRVS